MYENGSEGLDEVPDMEPEWMRLLWKSKTLTDQFGHAKVPWKLYKVKTSLGAFLATLCATYATHEHGMGAQHAVVAFAAT